MRNCSINTIEYLDGRKEGTDNDIVSTAQLQNKFSHHATSIIEISQIQITV